MTNPPLPTCERVEPPTADEEAAWRKTAGWSERRLFAALDAVRAQLATAVSNADNNRLRADEMQSRAERAEAALEARWRDAVEAAARAVTDKAALWDALVAYRCIFDQGAYAPALEAAAAGVKLGRKVNPDSKRQQALARKVA